MSLPAIDHEAASKAVFWQKEADAMADRAFAAMRPQRPEADNRGRNEKPPRQRKIQPTSDGLEFTLRNGQVVSLPDFEDSPDYSIESATQVIQCATSNKDLSQVCAERTGLVIPPDRHNDLVRRRQDIERQSIATAEKLERAGVGGYKPGDEAEWLFDPLHFTAYGGHGINAVEQIRFRRCNFIPAVAQQKRAFMLRHLELWLHHNPHARFWTFTSGQRCTMTELRNRLQELHRKISKLNAEPFLSDAGLKIVFRASETGSLTDKDGNEIKDADGNWLFHPHAHCIVEIKRRLTPERWQALLQDVKTFWKSHWDESGQIENVREIIKYPIKPMDIERLNDSETAELHDVMFRLHRVQPLGSLKEQIAGVRKAGDTLIWRKCDKDGGKVVRVKNWNSRPASAEKTEVDKQIETILRSPGESSPAQVEEPQAVAILAPGPYFGPTIRPAIIVRGAKLGTAEMSRICEIPKIRAMIRESLPGFLAGEEKRRNQAGPISIYTSPVTVREEQGEIGSVVAVPLGRKKPTK